MPGKKKSKKPPIASAKVLNRYKQLLEEHGVSYWLAKRRINPGTLAKEIDEHLHATSVKVFHHQGEIVYSAPMRDWAAQFRALELAVKLWNMYPTEKIELSMPDAIVTRIIEARKRVAESDSQDVES